MRQYDGYQLNLLQIQGHGVFFLDDVYIGLPGELKEETVVNKRGIKETVQTREVKYLNLSNFAREIAQHKNCLTLIVLDV